ncbi:uncharacterized protein F4812DRAFT_464970 [Daldinia caldariorum]|uniref:uncharacterized protein n=1 Tax=Daldinia caldariorum TaxID=326644 RepID=UPI0020082A77|nr:uncharacterized protein F4812DRAFT_464970 [Daldinia caldariorum]KAI1473041.1 hypothetical protein F4812DRAFT_464970 [Daldinia caldariorum]
MDTPYQELHDLYVTRPTPLDSVEELFRDLGNPLDNDKNYLYSIDKLDVKYRWVLQEFLIKAASSPPDHPYLQAIKNAANQVLEYTLRLHNAFVERLAHISLCYERDPRRPYEYHFFWTCKWVYQGRRIEKLMSPGKRAHRSEDEITGGSNNERDNNMNAETRIVDEKNGKGGDHDGPDNQNKDDNSADSNDTTPTSNPNKPPTLPTGQCARCGASEASLICTDLDLPVHTPLCLRRVQLSKVSLVLCKFMSVVESLATTFVVNSSWEESDMIMLKERIPYLEAMCGKYIMHRFPNSLPSQSIGSGTVFEDQYAREVIYLVRPLKEFILDELCQDFKIVTVLVKNASSSVCYQYDHSIRKSNMMDPHYVLRLTLLGGEKFALDLAAKRFGWGNYLMPWDVFENERIWKIVDTTRTAPTDFRDPSVPAAYSVSIHKEMLGDLIDETQIYMGIATSGESFLDVLTRISKVEYRIWEAGYIEALMKYCVEVAELRLAECRGYMYLNPDCGLQITTHRKDHVALADVWLSEEEAADLKDEREEALNAIWRDRINLCRVNFKCAPLWTGE